MGVLRFGGAFCHAGDGTFMFMVEALGDVKNIAICVTEREDSILHFF
jgi:hypothetical protein